MHRTVSLGKVILEKYCYLNTLGVTKMARLRDHFHSHGGPSSYDLFFMMRCLSLKVKGTNHEEKNFIFMILG
jgi:hypothetical protein